MGGWVAGTSHLAEQPGARFNAPCKTSCKSADTEQGISGVGSSGTKAGRKNGAGFAPIAWAFGRNPATMRSHPPREPQLMRIPGEGSSDWPLPDAKAQKKLGDQCKVACLPLKLLWVRAVHQVEQHLGQIPICNPWVWPRRAHRSPITSSVALAERPSSLKRSRTRATHVG